MKAFLVTIPIILCVLFIIVPVFEVIGLTNGLDFVLENEILTVSIQAFFAITALVILFITKPEYNRTGRTFLMLLTPISLFNTLCFVDSSWSYSILIAVISFACVFTLYIKFVPDSRIKATSAAFSVLIAIGIAVIYLWNLFSGIVVKQETVTTLDSPMGTYTAFVYSEESPLSSASTFGIKKNLPEIEAFIGNYFKKQTTIYEGEAYEAKTAKVSWIDDTTFVINEKEYKIG